MKRIILFVILSVAVMTLCEAKTERWWFMGYAKTEMVGDHAKGLNNIDNYQLQNFGGLQFGTTFIGITDKNLTFGGTFRYVEKGWIAKHDADLFRSDNYGYTTSKFSYLESIIRVGYNIEINKQSSTKVAEYNDIEIKKVSTSKMAFNPYVGLGMGGLLNSESYSQFTEKNLYSLVLGVDWNIIEKLMLNLSYDIGLIDVDKGSDFKYNTFNMTVGWKF